MLTDQHIAEALSHAYVRARADAQNIGSLRVMEKIGMSREGTLRQNRVVRGESIDEVWCGILRSEWKIRKQ